MTPVAATASSSCGSFLWWLGATVACLVVLRVLRALWLYFLRPATSFASFRGQWAVVTGASYGIGEQFARALAAQGLNVILVARSLDKLEAVAQDIARRHNVKTECLAVDITSADWGKVSKALRVEDRPVSVLINNVGGITEPFMPFIEYSLEDHDRCSRLNIAPVLALTRLCLPHMLKRGAGRVLNVSSLSCYAPYLLSCYASDKAKLNALTESIAMELGGTGVAVNCAVSGLVSTPATRHISRFDAPSAERWAHDALAMFGAANTVYVPYWFHAVQAFFATNVPEALRFATASASITPVQQHITRKSA